MVFTAIITVYGSLLKIFDPHPSIGYWVNHFLYRDALARGETHLGAAKTVKAMEMVVWNTAVQGSLSILFVVCGVIVMIVSVIKTIQALRGKGIIDTEEPRNPSRIFAPSGIIANPAEKKLEKEWAAFYEKYPEENLEGTSHEVTHESAADAAAHRFTGSPVHRLVAFAKNAAGSPAASSVRTPTTSTCTTIASPAATTNRCPNATSGARNTATKTTTPIPAAADHPRRVETSRVR